MATYLHGLLDVGDRGRLDRVAPPFAPGDDAFTLKDAERKPDGCARYPVGCTKMRFGKPFTFGLDAVDDVVPDPLRKV